jgi:cytochrome c2
MTRRFALVSCLAAALGCGSSEGERSSAPTSAPGRVAPVPAAPSEAAVHPPEAAADVSLAARGRRMVAKYECNRCHVIEGVAAATVDYDCAGCHRQIMAGTFDTTPEQLHEWQQGVRSLLDVPTLTATNRFRRAWLGTFLQDTHDLRPNLPESMPRFEMPAADAEAIAAFFVSDAEPETPTLGDPARGRALLEAKGCMSCHRMTGVAPIAVMPVPIALDGAALARGQKNAPDLRHARERLRAAELVRWLEDPVAVKPDAAMPKIPMEPEEIADVAAYLLTTPLGEAPASEIPARLPVLAREVTYEEVHDRVFGKICRHCHSDPSVVGGGGPGYAGGFGFAGRKLDLSSREGILAGSVGDDGKRRSLFAPLADGTPRLVAHLWARHAEDAGQPRPDVRGMPLGLAPISLEDIQLVETWVVQNRPATAAAATLEKVDLRPLDGPLTEQLTVQAGKALRAGKRPFAQMRADWCAICKRVEKSIASLELPADVGDVVLLRVDTDRFASELAEAGLTSKTIPAFYELDRRGRPTSHWLEGHRWGPNADVATALLRFFEPTD